MKFFKKNGFSIAEVLIAAGIIGILSLGIMRIMESMNQNVRFADLSFSEQEMKVNLLRLLSSEKNCRVSFAGNGPVGVSDSPILFKKGDIDFANVEITSDTEYSETDEGLDVSIWQSDLAGETRTRKKFNGENNVGSEDKSSYDKLKIKYIKLVMNNNSGSCSNNYCEGDQVDSGQLVIGYTKNIKKSQERLKKIVIDIDVSLKTTSSGDSTLLSCSANGGLKVSGSVMAQSTGFCINAYHEVPPTSNICPSMNGYDVYFSQMNTSNGIGFKNSCCYIPEDPVMPFCFDNIRDGSMGVNILSLPFQGCSFLNSNTNYDIYEVGVSSGSTCCLIPKNSSVSMSFCAPQVNTSGVLPQCPPISGYTVSSLDGDSNGEQKTRQCCWSAN